MNNFLMVVSGGKLLIMSEYLMRSNVGYVSCWEYSASQCF